MVEMFKKNEKAWCPLMELYNHQSLTPISTTLESNITDSQTLFSVAGISSINTGDTIKINDEYME